MESSNEAKFFGNLLPSSPDLRPIIEEIKKKYGLPEVSPDDEVIEEIYLEDRIVPLAEFREDISKYLHENLSYLPEKMQKQYKGAKLLSQSELPDEINILPEEYKQAMQSMFILTKKIAVPTLQGLEKAIDQITNMIYEYLLNGEMGEIPLDWSRIVTTVSSNDESFVVAMANQLANPEDVVKQFKQEYRKTFGGLTRPKITINIASAGYYLQLQKRNVSWRRIVEEFIRIEDIDLPPNTHSKDYKDRLRMCEQNLRKRMQRSKKILEIILVDTK